MLHFYEKTCLFSFDFWDSFDENNDPETIPNVFLNESSLS